MEVIKTAIEGVVIIEPRLFKDTRGYFFESFNQKEFEQKVRPVKFVQDNESYSSYGVLRGLHFQKPPFAQSKLVRVVQGTVLDVAVDIRRGSPTFGRHVAVELSGENHRQFFIPRGFAHGFCVLSQTALFQYKCDNFYAPESEGAIAWDDPFLAIDWRMEPQHILLSDKDRRHPRLDDAAWLFNYNDDLYGEEI
ncbi:MAG TPA: dTDP-4-dehydrorhamnose 3,5-epimerase [Candidatus Coprenecus stercoravium]|uniref:dTDP-4-dehydrorhamnose 3,5-epimerase n=1 Tax=Candidatus Coprenecus stercoravium TaxID=2840735 RepID=A0A9D2GPL9_9BACT|nr:dTDP-4-dehydrorhamnose 3,5-epimerase [Candidatus Coprenecus stercoravium]